MLINIYYNGASKKCLSGSKLQDILAQYSDTKQHYAVAVNGNFTPRSIHAQIILAQDDSIDVVSPVTGG